MKTSLKLAMLMALISCLFVSIISANTDTSQSHTGYMGDDVNDFVISLDLAKGQFVIAQATSTSGNLDPYLALKDSNGNTLIENDDIHATSLDARIGFQIPSQGKYDLIVSNIRETSGNYLLDVVIGDSGTAVLQDSSDVETIDGTYDEIGYDYDFSAGDTVILRANNISGDLDPYIILFDPSGNAILIGDDINRSDTNAYLVYSFTQSGTYEIIVSGWEGTSGAYQLDIEIYEGVFGDGVEDGGNNVVSASTDQSTSYTGYMSDDTEAFTVSLDLSEGQFIIAQAISTSDDLDPYLILKGSNGNTLIENDDMDLQSLDARIGYHVPANGTYELILSNIVDTAGEYLLEVVIGGGGTSTYQEASETEYVDGDYDEITYEFEFEAGDTVIFQAETVAGDLDPYIILFDPSGDVIAFGDDIRSGDLDTYLVYSFSETGTYEVVVSGWQGTSGDYVLDVEIFEGAFDDIVRLSSSQITDSGSIDFGDAEDVINGSFDGEFDVAVYTLTLDEGDGVIIHGQSEKNVLDIIVRVLDEDGNILSDSDDWSEYWHVVVAYFVAPETATYYVEVSAENGTQGDYALLFEYADGKDVMKKMRVELSGDHHTVETENFIIHYTLDGDDAMSHEQAYFIADIMENVYDRQINELGWYAPVRDGNRGGDNRYDVYMQNILETDEVYGYAVPEYPIQDNPNSPHEEEYAMGGYLIVASKYNDTPEEVERLLISTLGHEFHHLIQFGYNGTGSNWWYYESTATYMEVATLPPYNDAVGYVEDVLTYPEICFGAMNDADPTGGMLMYGSWLFIQSMIDAFGEQVLNEYWENLAIHGHGWEALEITFAKYDALVPDVLANYHLQNLVLDYDLAPFFEGQDRVWVDGYIDDTGSWEMAGSGVQELASNYYLIDLSDGVYQFSLVDAPDYLELYGVGINTDNGTADRFNLGMSGAIDVSGYDEFVLMVFNTAYHDELDNCDYESFSIGVKQGGEALPVADTLDATNYLSLYE